jgi:hypothetical protein
VAVTAAGEAKVAEAQAIIEDVQAAVLAALPAEQRQSFLDGLVVLVTERLVEPAECRPSPRRPRAPHA